MYVNCTRCERCFIGSRSNNQTDQVDEREGLEREGLEGGGGIGGGRFGWVILCLRLT
jgi:hypothetical protein